MRLLKLTLFTILVLGVGAARSAEPVKIRVAWQAPMNWGSILLEKKDLAKHLGKSYVLEPVRYNASPPMITALAVGELEIAELSFSTIR
jgi:sulfonate transport system substrate-binding protein